MELIRLENITKTYHLGEVDVPVLKGVSLSIRRGEMVALMGASGSGKTTLMNISRLSRPAQFRAVLVGRRGDERVDAQTNGHWYGRPSWDSFSRVSICWPAPARC